MPTRRTPDDTDFSDSVAAFRRAAGEWHRRCHRACSEHDRCPERFTAVIGTLVTWIAENPRQARLYWIDDETCLDPDLLVHAVAARQDLTRIVLDTVPPGRSADRHRVRIEFLVGLIRQVVRAELRKDPFDDTRLAYKLTRLAALLVANGYHRE